MSFLDIHLGSSMISTDTQSRTTDLNRQLTSTTSTHSLNDTAQIKTLTDQALSAEKRANHASNQLAMLEAKLAEIQSKAGKAEDKWEARVREYENRLRVAGEKIKTEKQGGKERALQLEGQVRWVFLLFHLSHSTSPLLIHTTRPLLFAWTVMRNCANYQGTGTTGRFSKEEKCKSREHSSNCLAPDAVELAVGRARTMMKACLYYSVYDKLLGWACIEHHHEDLCDFRMVATLLDFTYCLLHDLTTDEYLAYMLFLSSLNLAMTLTGSVSPVAFLIRQPSFSPPRFLDKPRE